ncbi:phage tail protein [Paenibacillus sambharensis]|uniref:Phage tail protein n=1 Tax=Paenibacillus sambharensis TaxID=1803190 RepID=A0A2W1LJ14_9BACL|nr:tail fiber protein [Paenibacillus sambharensis]PZD94524.1 phage tail protein [Paenibacillus sambharensis]
MSEPFVAEIRIFAGNFAPSGWAFCNGQIMPISQNTALFSLLGTTYGGNGMTTFALPNLQGRAPMHPGQGAGLTERTLGEQGGTESVQLLESEMPFHVHNLQFGNGGAPQSNPQDALPSPTAGRRGGLLYSPGPGSVMMNSTVLGVAGAGAPHTNMQPYVAVNYIIALQGIFPPRS